MTFTRFVAAACRRKHLDLTEFEREGFHYAHNTGAAPEDAFDFLGRFGTVEDIRSHRTANYGPQQ